MYQQSQKSNVNETMEKALVEVQEGNFKAKFNNGTLYFKTK